MSIARSLSSPYMHWAKTRFLSQPRYGLTNSGVYNLPIRELAVTLDDLELSGPSYYGYAPLQQALARHCGVEESCVVAATGTSGANHLALSALLGPGDDCLMESPAYDPLIHAASHTGATVRQFDLDPENGFALDLQAVERALTPRTRLIVVTNLHNPSSAVIPQAALQSLAALAREAKAHVLVDEVYREAMFEDAPPSAFHLDPAFVVTSSLTKAYGLSGLRCGWILADPELAGRMWRLNDLFGVIPAHAAERLSILALEQLPAIAARAQQLLTKNRGLMHAFLDSRPELKGGRTAYGTVSFPRLETGSVEEFCQLLLAKYETSVVPGSFFGAPQHLRIGYGCPTEILQAGLERMAAALDSRK